MKKLITTAVIFMCFHFNSICQNKNCETLKGTWYFILMDDAKEPVSLQFTNCEWKEDGNPMGNRKGTANYSVEKKKYQVIGLVNGDNPVLLYSTAEYSYLKWDSDWTGKPDYLVLTRKKQTGKYYMGIKQKLMASGK